MDQKSSPEASKSSETTKDDGTTIGVSSHDEKDGKADSNSPEIHVQDTEKDEKDEANIEKSPSTLEEQDSSVEQPKSVSEGVTDETKEDETIEQQNIEKSPVDTVVESSSSVVEAAETGDSSEKTAVDDSEPILEKKGETSVVEANVESEKSKSDIESDKSDKSKVDTTELSKEIEQISTEENEKTPEKAETEATTSEEVDKIPVVDVEADDGPVQTAKTVESSAKISEEDRIESVTLDGDDEKEEEKHGEPEKTEFVQISQDKTDDSQIEAQTIEAEDPFGGDNLTADTLETIDGDDIDERNINFCKLGDQADNLQDVINATSCNESEDNVADKNESSKVLTDSEITEISGSSEKTTDESKEKMTKDSGNETPSDEGIKAVSIELLKDPDLCEKSKTVNKDTTEVEVIPIESEEQSTVLPGQDDELCIIPDDMKVIIPQHSKKVINDDKISEKEPSKTSKGSDKNSEVIESNQEVHRDKVIEKVTDKKDESNKSKEIERVPIEITDSVIDIEDESKNTEVEEISTMSKCKQCKEKKSCKIKVKIGSSTFNVCSKNCQEAFMNENGKATDIPSDGANSKYEKRCASCLLIVETNDDRNLSWETMEFCNEECLGKFQTKYGSYCRNCNGTVQPISLGKYCVRFGYDVRQFCCSTCLEEFKKGLKVCSYCQKDISSGTDGFLAPVGDKGQFKDFCTQQCMEKYSRMNSSEPPPPERKACSVCQEEKIIFCEVQIDRGQPQAICSEPCFAAFKFVNKVDPDQCATCKKYFQVGNKKSTVVFYNNEAHTFCNKSCLNIFIITNRKIVPCNWCKVKKYNFDMIRKELKTGQVVMMCSLNCLTLYQVSINAVSAKRIKCDLCKEFSQAQYHLTMSDATIRNFCSYNCVMKFQGQYTKSPITIPAGEDAPVPTGMPKRTYPGKVQVQGLVKKPGDIQLTNIQAINNLQQNIQNKKSLPVISSVASLASLSANGQASPINQKATTNVVNLNNATITNPTVVSAQQEVIYKRQIITRPPSPVEVHNKMTQCKPMMHTKGVSVRPHPCVKSTQTDEIQKVIIPIPVPIYVPFPVHMFSFPFPVPMPFPLPIPVPIFIPTTRNSTKGIFKDLKRIQEKLPSDPFEAELLMMAEMVATDKKKVENDSESSDNDNDNDTGNFNATDHDSENEKDTDNLDKNKNDNDSKNDTGNKQETVDNTNNTFGDDMFQMALKMATSELEEPAVDLEAALTPSTITASQSQIQTEGSPDSDEHTEKNQATTRGRKRTVSTKAKTVPNKKGRRSSSTGETTPALMPPPPSATDTQTATLPQSKLIETHEKPDANMALKFTFGVNAWRQWVISKNAEFERQSTSTRKVKLFKTDLLQLTADELNYSLCLFVKEVRKPNGAEYAPDTIYYLCLGIQQYLFENNRIDNIFTDTYYEKFTDCLNQIATKFSVLYNDAQYIVTRVEEEHLWECKQLGAHSPHVLLSTLMFFNTKHFNLVTVEEHMQLSFSHIMKHWKRNTAATQPMSTGGKPRNVLLRFYPPQAALDANSRKKKVYEQQENEENPLRCPVKLYEFYLSKCPESVKTRNDVFYLLPERSCVPDSPVWYSTSPLAKDQLIKMLNRVKMVKEINVALLNS